MLRKRQMHDTEAANLSIAEQLPRSEQPQTSRNTATSGFATEPYKVHNVLTDTGFQFTI